MNESEFLSNLRCKAGGSKQPPANDHKPSALLKTDD